MPIYEFECVDCKEVFETIVSSAKRINEVVCKSCKSSNIKKTISAGTYRLGSGSLVSSAPAGGNCKNRGGFT